MEFFNKKKTSKSNSKVTPADNKYKDKQSPKQVTNLPNQTYGYGPEESETAFGALYDEQEFYIKTTGKASSYSEPINLDKKAEPWPKTYHPKPLYEKRSAIILVVESSEDMLMYKSDISRLINKIITDNKEQFFMFMRFGNATKYFELIFGEKLQDKDIVSNLLTLENSAPNTFDIYAVLKHIDYFVRENLTLYKTFNIGLRQYILEDARVIFIGTGKTDESTYNPSFLLKDICNNNKIKTVKYFCLKDEHTIKAAALGFPVIGHIESNFYK